MMKNKESNTRCRVCSKSLIIGSKCTCGGKHLWKKIKVRKRWKNVLHAILQNTRMVIAGNVILKMLNKKKCPEWLRTAYRKAVEYICENCKKYEDVVGKLQVHRIVRGNMGGTYKPSNCKIVCKSCHGLYHGNEFKNVQGK